MSDFRPDTSGAVVNTFQAHLFSCTLGREGCCKQITLACARSVSATQGLPPLTAHTVQALGWSTGNRLRLALGCMHLPDLNRPALGTQVVLRGADSVGPAFCALPRSKYLRCLVITVTVTYHLSIPAAQFSGCTGGTPSQVDDD